MMTGTLTWILLVCLPVVLLSPMYSTTGLEERGLASQNITQAMVSQNKHVKLCQRKLWTYLYNFKLEI